MLATAVVCTALESAAQPEEPTRVQLAFKAPASCANSADFERRVRQRSDRIVFVPEAPYTGSAKVTLEPSDDSVRVRVSWSRDGDDTTGREFNATSCAEALDAAALVIAISFDPSAPDAAAAAGSLDPSEGRPEGAPEPADADGSSTSARPSSKDTQAAAEDRGAAPPESRASAQLETERARSEPARPEPGRAGTTRVVFGASALVDGIGGVTPTAMAGVGLNLELAIGQSWASPQLRLAGIHYFGDTYAAEGGDARFELDTVEVEACPFRLGSAVVSLRPCAALAGGRLVASGRSTENPNSYTRALWIVGGALALGMRPTSLLLVSADLSVGAPTTRDSFQFAPDEFHQVSSVIVSGSLGLGIEFR